MSQGNDFNYSAATDTGTAGSEEVWFVAVASDDIKQMNVDQLDEAFRLGVITEETPVWTEGMEAWQALGKVLGSDSEEGDSASASHEEQQAPVAPLSAGGFGAVTLQSVQHSYAPGPSSVAPVTSSYAPSYAPNTGLSTGPVALNVDEEMSPIKHGRSFRPERWALGAAAIIAVGVAVYNNFSSSVASAGTQPQPATTALAARPYDGAEPGEAMKKAEPEASAATKPIAEEAPAAAPAPKPAAITASDDAEPPASTKKATDKESLKGSFSKAFNTKKPAPTAKATKTKPRKAATRATKPRAAKGKKPGVAREKSAFDPLNDSLP